MWSYMLYSYPALKLPTLFSTLNVVNCMQIFKTHKKVIIDKATRNKSRLSWRYHLFQHQFKTISQNFKNNFVWDVQRLIVLKSLGERESLHLGIKTKWVWLIESKGVPSLKNLRPMEIRSSLTISKSFFYKK